MISDELISTRIVLKKSFAFLPTEEIHESLIPNLRDTTIKVLASPQLGANFAEYLLKLERNGGSIKPFKEEGIEHFLYVLEGEGELETDKDGFVISKGDYAYVPPGSPLSFQASKDGLKIILLKKRYEPFSSETPSFIFNNEKDVKEDYEDSYSWQYLIPFELKYDMRMDIGNFPPGIGFDYVETHFEEHGMYILSGRGLYYLGDRWYPYEEGDYVWMAPFCPQSVYPVGKEKTRYLIYKNWYRDIRL
jgi:(S)-ureidoglycine aminohydrolase